MVFGALPEVYTHGFDTVIDVRSPAEFAEDHVPGAINLPALNNEERARVGTIYVQDSPFKARKIGAALVAANAARHLQTTLIDKPGGWRPLVYCWRGGQRSGSFATILTQIGWRPGLIDGGYRTYRRLVVETMHTARLPHQLVLLDGNTGTAKTEILGHLAAQGIQTLDLEALAGHRGSIFGAGDRKQPSQKAFEGALAAALNDCDPSMPVVVEAESSKIGQCQIPRAVWQAMCVAPRITLRAPLNERASYLTRTYADIAADTAQLLAIIAHLRRLHGRERVADWQALASTKQFAQLARELMAHHYDPRYAKSRDRLDSVILGTLNCPSLDPSALSGIARQIAQTVQTAPTLTSGGPS